MTELVAELLEARAKLFRKELRLFPGREMSSLVEFVVMNEFRVLGNAHAKWANHILLGGMLSASSCIRAEGHRILFRVFELLVFRYVLRVATQSTCPQPWGRTSAGAFTPSPNCFVGVYKSVRGHTEIRLLVTSYKYSFS